MATDLEPFALKHGRINLVFTEQLNNFCLLLKTPLKNLKSLIGKFRETSTNIPTMISLELVVRVRKASLLCG